MEAAQETTDAARAAAAPDAELVEVLEELAATRQLGDVQRVVRHAARRLTGADGATFVLRDGDFCHYADEDAIAPLWKGRRYPIESCISGWALLNRKPAVIEDVGSDSRVAPGAYEATFVKSLAVVPIRAGEPVGAICNYWAEPHAASERELSLLRALADATSVAIDRIRVRDASQTDELTGINNRRGFFALGEPAFAAAVEAEAECAAAFVDVDGLKLINTTFGYGVGSRLIRETADALSSIAREGDIVGRLGGDEFALLRPRGAASTDALEAEIAAAIGRVNRGGRPCRLAVTVGVAIAQGSRARSLDRLLARADEAMYRHKPAARGPRGSHVRASERP